MISLKKYLDMEMEKPPSMNAPDPREILSAALDSYRSALLAMGANGMLACSAVGSELQKELGNLESRLLTNVTSASIKEAEKEVEDYLE